MPLTTTTTTTIPKTIIKIIKIKQLIKNAYSRIDDIEREYSESLPEGEIRDPKEVALEKPLKEIRDNWAQLKKLEGEMMGHVGGIRADKNNQDDRDAVNNYMKGKDMDRSKFAKKNKSYKVGQELSQYSSEDIKKAFDLTIAKQKANRETAAKYGSAGYKRAREQFEKPDRINEVQADAGSSEEKEEAKAEAKQEKEQAKALRGEDKGKPPAPSPDDEEEEEKGKPPAPSPDDAKLDSSLEEAVKQQVEDMKTPLQKARDRAKEVKKQQMEVEAFSGGSMSGVSVGNEGDNSHFLRHAKEFKEFLETKDLTEDEALTLEQMEELIKQKKAEAERKMEVEQEEQARKEQEDYESTLRQKAQESKEEVQQAQQQSEAAANVKAPVSSADVGVNRPSYDITGVSRDNPGLSGISTPSQVMKDTKPITQDQKEKRNKKTIETLKAEIRALHTLYDDDIPAFKSKPHQKQKGDALESNDIEVVRRHHRDMEDKVLEYFSSGAGDKMKVGVIVPIQNFMKQFVGSGNLGGLGGQPIMTPPQNEKEAEAQSEARQHAGAVLQKTGEDRFNRAVATNVYFQRGGRSAFKQKEVRGYTLPQKPQKQVRAKGRFIQPKYMVDAPYQHVLKRPDILVNDATIRLKA